MQTSWHCCCLDPWRLTRMTTIPITKRGAEKLKQELHHLKTVERPSVITAIAEGRIQEIEGKLSVAQVIDPGEVDGGGKVVFGATVQLEDEESGETVTYQ